MIRKRPKVLGRLDVATLLGVSQQYVTKLIEEEKIPSQQTSAGIVFLESDVLKYKKSRMQKAKSDTRIKLGKGNKR